MSRASSVLHITTGSLQVPEQQPRRRAEAHSLGPCFPPPCRRLGLHPESYLRRMRVKKPSASSRKASARPD